MTHEQAETSLAVERYLLDEMDEGEREHFEEHYFDCTVCAGHLTSGAQLMANGRQVAEGCKKAEDTRATLNPARPTNLLSMPNPSAWLRPALTMALAASLALVAVLGYQQMIVVPGLQRQIAQLQAPQAYVPAVLYAATRGEVPSVTVSSSQALFSIAFDVENTSQYPFCRILLEDQQGKQHGNFVVAAPPPGTMLHLLLPAQIPNGAYTVTVQGETNGQPTSGSQTESRKIGRYRFTLAHQ